MAWHGSQKVTNKLRSGPSFQKHLNSLWACRTSHPFGSTPCIHLESPLGEGVARWKAWSFIWMVEVCYPSTIGSYKWHYDYRNHIMPSVWEEQHAHTQQQNTSNVRHVVRWRPSTILQKFSECFKDNFNMSELLSKVSNSKNNKMKATITLYFMH
jgi:hypothetical protein